MITSVSTVNRFYYYKKLYSRVSYRNSLSEYKKIIML